MARGSKDYGKVVHKVSKGAKSKAKIDSIQKMVEAMINGDVESAEEELSEYIRMTSRKIILGEAVDKDESDKDESDEDESDEDESDEDESDEDESDEDESDDK